jgi:hypothetical protein
VGWADDGNVGSPAEQESGADWRAGELHLLKSSDFPAHCFDNNT